MRAYIDFIKKVDEATGEIFIMYPRTLIECITNRNGDNLEDTLKQFMTDNLSLIVSDNAASKEYVHEQIANVNHLKREIVTTIPTTETAEENVIYMYKVDDAVGNDLYQEYQLINGEVVLIGDTSIDLSDYVRCEALDKLINGETVVAKANTASVLDGSITPEVLTTSILEKALEVNSGIYNYNLDGNNYSSDDLPKTGYKFSQATIRKIDDTNITVILWGTDDETIYDPVINHYNSTILDWGGWKKLSDDGNAATLNSFTAKEIGESGVRNLLKYPYENGNETISGIEWTVNSDGSINANGTATGTSEFFIMNNKENPFSTGTYTLSAKTHDVNIAMVYIRFYDDADMEMLSLAVSLSKGYVTFEVLEEYKTCTIGIRIYNGKTADNITIKPMLEKGKVDHDYTPYHIGGAEDSNKLGGQTVKEWQNKLDNIQTTSKGSLSQAGWYRVAEYKAVNIAGVHGECANSCNLIIKRMYSNQPSEVHNLRLESVYNSQELKSVASKVSAGHYITKARYSIDTTTFTAYLEIYYAGSNGNATTIEITHPSDVKYCWKAITPTLTSETVEGVTVTTTYDIPANAKPVTNLDLANYLPLSGGGIVESISDTPIIVKTINENENEIYIGYTAIDKWTCFMGFKDGEPHIYNKGVIHYAGNKPSGSYVGNGDATPRVMNVGGIGSAVLVTGATSYAMLVTKVGGIGISVNGDTPLLLSYTQCHFENGVLSIATDNATVNASGGTYTYQVL